MKKQSYIFIIASIIVVQACTSYQLVPSAVYHNTYPVNSSQQPDSAILMMLLPYKDSISKSMTKVIGFATATLSKNQSQNAIGNFFTDAMKTMAEKKFNRKVDAAIMNGGGIRSYIPKGDITIAKMYELMPFDNLLVLQELKGSILRQLLDHAAGGGGWAVCGITMKVVNRKADSIYLNGEPINDNRVYVIAQSDYVAAGGDYSDMLKPVGFINKGYLLRDALTEYVEKLTSMGKPVTASGEKRIIYADQP